MKIALYSRANMKHTPDELKTLMSALSDSGLEYKLNSSFAELIEKLTGIRLVADKTYDILEKDCSNAQMVVSYGGDGTFLECIKLMGSLEVPILGINSGRLGFLANVPKEDIKKAFKDIAEKKFTVRESGMLEVTGDFPVKPHSPYAFNEFSIQRSGTGMILVEIYVDGELVAAYWGDGVMLSTPAGSTAYSLSVGGPVVAPECGCFVIAPIAPHNLTVRPVVIPDHCEVVFKIDSRGHVIYAGLDSDSYESHDKAVFKVKKADNSIILALLQNISFYDTLRNKLMWGFDGREEGK